MRWSYERQTAVGGRFEILAHKMGGRRRSITRWRNSPTQFSYSSGDPFGDSTASLTFPGITPFDDLDAPEFQDWLDNYANVDIYFVPALTRPNGSPWVDFNPVSGEYDLYTPMWIADPAHAGKFLPNFIKVWEGFFASLEFTQDNSNAQLEIQCQGALFQLDHYLQKPFYPSNPYPLETLIQQAFSHQSKPHLRTGPLVIQFPDGWTKKAPKYANDTANPYSPIVKPGTNYTGYASRNTGSWEHTLTGFIQDQLSVMITDNKSGVEPGNQWTITQRHQGVAYPHGRQPVLQVRDRFADPDFSIWVGQPGVNLSLSADSTQSENVVYGDGTDIDGEVWRNAVISDDGSRTDYLPLAANRTVYPPNNNRQFDKRAFVSEAYVKFGSGFSQVAATTVAEQQLTRDQQPGWSGTITLTVDPAVNFSRWAIKAGQTVLLQGFVGTGSDGFRFHIASVQASPMDGTVSLTVDSRYRDLLTVAEAQARTRDPLDPVRMLQVNKQSVLIEDIQAPWDYTAGSGFVPKDARTFYKHKPNSVIYPYASWAQQHPPKHHPHWYVKIPAAAATSRQRWAGPIPILTAEKFTASRTEFYLVNNEGHRIAVPFHVSFWDRPVHVDNMPNVGHIYSPFLNNAFETVNPATGQVFDKGNHLAPVDGFIIGWGNRADGIYNRAGFSPGSEAEGDKVTGLFFDDSTWSQDNTTNKDYQLYAKPGKEPASAITIYAMFYAEYTEAVYVQGRIFRQNPGVS